METILKMARAIEGAGKHTKLTRLDTQYYVKECEYVGFATYTVYDDKFNPLTHMYYEIHEDATVTKTKG